MQFIKNGPNVPEGLLQAHEDGRVVFFCGAGISYPARLPGFKELVDGIYESLNEEPSPVEEVALKNGQYDTAIGLLEDRIRRGRATVREQLVQILTPDLSAPRATATHKALLTLGKTRATHQRVGRYRLVTTNFDRLFEEAIAESENKLQPERFAAPLLPVPKSKLDGLVYLHGLLSESPTDDELDRLIVSSGDFGRAYLTERWAARFVGELLRNYTVCFVGYSINDPVLRYMMDALATDRRLGESPPKAFALGSYRNHEESHAKNEWKAKNVTPILYRETPKHAYLHRTLKRWSEIYRDGISGKERIVVELAKKKPSPSTQQDDYVGRLLWALSDQNALPAKLFAECDPLPSLDWLNPLTETRFGHRDLARFGIQQNEREDKELEFSLVTRPAPYTCAQWMSLVAGDPVGVGRFDRVMRQLARWLARHLDDPKLILWVARKGGAPHSEFAWQIEDALKKNPPRPRMQTLWHLALTGRLERGTTTQSDVYRWKGHLKRNGLTSSVRLQLRDLLSPCVHIRAVNQRVQEGEEPVDWEITLQASRASHILKGLRSDAEWQQALPELLSDATTLLRDALDLMRELGGADNRHDLSVWHQPSIQRHPQNRGFHDWTALIDLARDAWEATAARFPERAKIEVERWLSIPYPLFRRLAFFAASKGTNSGLYTSRQALEYLLAEEHWWLWSAETRREAIQLVTTIARNSDAPIREALGRAILRGPLPEKFRKDLGAKALQERIDWEIWFRLAKCKAAGATLGAGSDQKLDSLSQQYPDWELASDGRDEFPVWVGRVRRAEMEPTPPSSRELVEWLHEHASTNPRMRDDWRERCKSDFRRTAVALLHLAREGEWPAERWNEALYAWSDDNLAPRSWRWVGRVLASAPEEFVRTGLHALGSWLNSIAKTFEGRVWDLTQSR